MKIKVMRRGDTLDILLKRIYSCMVISYKKVRIEFCTNVVCISVQISNNRTIQNFKSRRTANKNILLCCYLFDKNYYYLGDKSERLLSIGGTSGRCGGHLNFTETRIIGNAGSMITI